MELERNILHELYETAESYPVTTIIGPRQSGKTTLAKAAFPQKPYVNLEAPDQRELALQDPRHFLEKYPDGAIFDEIQRTPELLSYIQTIVDEKEEHGLFILTGSHQLSLQEGISQSLAGRTGMLHLLPLSLSEIKTKVRNFSLEEQLFYGGYPKIYKQNISPQRFYRDYVQTYLERDVKQISHIKDLDQFRRFLQLCASRAGSLLDYTSLSNELGIARSTAKEWLSVLQASFILNTLPPYFENFGKRITKSPKIYFNDVGLLCYLLGIQEPEQIETHPLRGMLFENLVYTELKKLHYNRGKEANFYFYRDSNQIEIDLMYQQGSDLI
ncbi:MAG: ATP-binding protein, partial [Coxiellaceae bacterium]|nr:ATP-binding protein [Coxiellaceae bacterium]